MSQYTYVHPAAGIERLDSQIYLIAQAGGRQLQFDPGRTTASNNGDTMEFVSRDPITNVEVKRTFTVRGNAVDVEMQMTNVGQTQTNTVLAIAHQLPTRSTYVATENVDKGAYEIKDVSGRGYNLEAVFSGATDRATGASISESVNGRTSSNATSQAGRWFADLAPGETATARATFTTTLQAGALDTDGDGLLDEWERKGYPLEDGTVLPLHRWGADPKRKDLFLQLNWMESEWESSGCDRVSQFAATGEELEQFLACSQKNTNSYRPSISTLRQLEKLFADNGIALHIDAGDLYKSADMVGYTERYGGKTLKHRQGFFPTDKSRGLTLLETRDELLGDRAGVFRVGVIGDRKAPNDRSSGEGIVGDGAFFVAKGAGLSNQDLLRNTILHEFGHTLGLTHYGAPGRPEGVPVNQFLPNYRSAMNYLYQFSEFNFSSAEATGAAVQNQCRPYECYNGSYSVPADWQSLQLRGNHFGANAATKYVEIEEPTDTAPVIPQDDETVRDLTIATADKHEGMAGFELEAGEDNGIVTLRNDNVLRGQLSNLGLDSHRFTVTAIFNNGSAPSQLVTVPGVLNPRSTHDVLIPVPNAAALKGPKTTVQIQVRNEKKALVFDEKFSVSVLDYNRDQAAKALSELEKSGASQEVKDRARARLNTAPTGTPAAKVPQPAPAPAEPGKEGGSSTAGIIAIVVAILGLIGAGAFAVSQGLIQIPNLPF